MATINSREFAEHVEQETRGLNCIRGSRILKIAKEFRGEPFTDSFDVRSYHLSGASTLAER
eukprot:3114568-Karenia_brevis.AAC.1